MDTKLSHLDQYKMLREEIMQHMREVNHTELWGVTVAGVVYAWLILNKGVVPHAAWFISPFVILFCSIRIFSITRRMGDVAEYLRRIEKVAFVENPELPGWERYLKENVGHYKPLSPAFFAYVFWPAMIIFSFFVSWHLSCIHQSKLIGTDTTKNAMGNSTYILKIEPTEIIIEDLSTTGVVNLPNPVIKGRIIIK